LFVTFTVTFYPVTRTVTSIVTDTDSDSCENDTATISSSASIYESETSEDDNEITSDEENEETLENYLETNDKYEQEIYETSQIKLKNFIKSYKFT
jgi:hypothetical protein